MYMLTNNACSSRQRTKITPDSNPRLLDHFYFSEYIVGSFDTLEKISFVVNIFI